MAPSTQTLTMTMLHSQLRVPRRFPVPRSLIASKKGGQRRAQLVLGHTVGSPLVSGLVLGCRKYHLCQLSTGLTTKTRPKHALKHRAHSWLWFCEDPPTARLGLSHLPPGRRKVQEGAALPAAQPSPPGLPAALFPEGRFQTSWGTVVPTSATFLEKRHKESQLLRGGWLLPGTQRAHVITQAPSPLEC